MNSKPYNIIVFPKQGESQEKMIRRFFKKCKKQEIIQEHLSKTSFFVSKNEKKRKKIKENAFLRQKKAKNKK